MSVPSLSACWCLSLCLPIDLSLCASVYLSRLSVRQSFSQFVCLPVCLPVSLSLSPSILSPPPPLRQAGGWDWSPPTGRTPFPPFVFVVLPSFLSYLPIPFCEIQGDPKLMMETMASASLLSLRFLMEAAKTHRGTIKNWLLSGQRAVTDTVCLFFCSALHSRRRSHFAFFACFVYLLDVPSSPESPHRNRNSHMNKTKQNKIKQNETKRNETKQNKTKLELDMERG